MHAIALDGESLTIEDVVAVARGRPGHPRVTLPAATVAKLERNRAALECALAGGEPIYGVTTGFGALQGRPVAPAHARQLQLNVVRSHAAGVGPPLETDVVRAMLLLRANSLAKGQSGVRPQLVALLVELLNRGVHPVVPSRGSVGASGDLAPLSHIALALMGEGEVFQGIGPEAPGGNGPVRGPAGPALALAGLAPFRFAPKEGISFINGTQAQTAMLALLVHDAECLWRTAVGAAAMSLEALRGTPTPLDPRIHAARPHPGQGRAAELMRALLEASEIRESHRENDPRVQDAYSIRCAPQVLGAVADAIRFARETASIELNASTDNPLVFEDGEILSGGNFHGQPVAQALDVLAIGLTTLQAIAERRVERLVNPDLSQGLPAFLTRDPGLCSGYMMVQITAASLVAESRALAAPASIGSIPTDANQEDFVPMGMAAAFKARRILENARRVVAAELLCAAQGLEFLRPLRPGRGVEALFHRLRDPECGVSALADDRAPGPDLDRVTALVESGALDPAPGLPC
jgi:histidine ammonia-lyase